MDWKEKTDRRKYCKYVAGAVVTVVAGVAGYWTYEQWKKLYKTPVTPTSTTSTTSTTSVTPTPDITPPVIKDLKWEPTRVVNSKVYDGNVSFVAEDLDSLIAEAYLDFEPVYPSHLPREAFPEESSRSYSFAGASKRESFSQAVTDLKGGKEYQAKIRAKDKAGNESESSLDIPYVREFENIAPLDDITVIADYYFGYRFPPEAWRRDSQKLHVYTPLLGEYDSSNSIVIGKHIDYATGYGIDAFAVSWWGLDTLGANSHDYDLPDFEEVFLNSQLLKDIKFFILYENTGRLKIQNPSDPAEKWIQDLDDPFNRDRLISDFEYFATKYFSNPSYLKVKGKPAVIFDYTTCFRGDIEKVFGDIREKVKNKGWDLYLINDVGLRAFNPKDIVNNTNPQVSQIINSTDSIGYCFYMSPDAEKVYKGWYDFSKERQKDFLPYFGAGFEPSPLVIPNPPVHYSPEIFDRTLTESLKYNIGGMIGTRFNAWYWGSHIEPSVEYKFLYLDMLKDHLKNLEA